MTTGQKQTLSVSGTRAAKLTIILGYYSKMVFFNDAQELSKLYPETFEAPSQDELASVREGSLVKICANDVERFWVIVKNVDGDKLQGTVDNELSHGEVHHLKCDDVVSFELRHIYQIFQD
ncbi:hypothetical protein ACO0K2_18490 [Undibacterium sp. MH2W]|uniref:hypothetical protein n=1 Tax=Undibacterium sp. MH2W TaxID=3413044 RepID=UPI003BF34C36